MPARTASAVWNGSLEEGDGRTQFAHGACDLGYSAGSRFRSEEGSNPEELIGAALAACYSMALSGMLGQAGHAPKSIETKATVRIDQVGEGYAITSILIETVGDVPGADADTFRSHAANAKENCPVAKALGAVDIELDARLK